MTLALTADHSERIDLQEDYDLLKILRKKLFRRAIQGNHHLPDLPDMESLAGGDTDELADAIAELNEAGCIGKNGPVPGRDPVTLSLHKWRTELAA